MKTKGVSARLLALLLLSGEAVRATDVESSPLARLSFQQSMQAGFHDTNGNLVAGTEIMHLMPHRGRLYAGTSLWMESDPSVPKACQVLVLDSPKGAWRVEHQFTRGHVRLGSLKTVTFSTDAAGHRIDPVPLLLAAPDVARGPVEVFCRDDATGGWTPSRLGSVAQHASTRALGLHHDRITRIDKVFAGTDKLGVIGGVYDPTAPGRVRWDSVPELSTPAGERVMAFCDCNGAFYCATSRHIYRRTDGTTPRWQEIYVCAQETSPSGIRGLSAVPNPAGPGEVLLFVALSRVRRLDPTAGDEETLELRLPAFLSRQLGVGVGYALAAYNEFLPYMLPSGETVWLFGLESTYLPAAVEAQPPPPLRLFVREKPRRSYFAAEARFCIRHAKGADIRYELATVAAPRESVLVSTRVIVQSPFPGDRGRAFYFGGFDCNSVPSHNSAWIYRAELPDL